MPKLKMSGTAPLLPLCAFMACTGLSFPLLLGIVLIIHTLLLKHTELKNNAVELKEHC
jgi:hypothetical protein